MSVQLSETSQPAPAGALAIFVKTPGLSGIKTRLAARLGLNFAAEFYSLAVSAVRAVVETACGSIANPSDQRLIPYWAVAESEGMEASVWSSFSQIWQGTGGLGTRLSTVYNQLLERHSFVLLIGADSPQISVELLKSCGNFFFDKNLVSSTNATFLLGRSDDGGYYLFGGNQPIEKSIWESVPYSVETTAEEFTRQLRALGEIQELPWLFDIDTIEDLRRLSELDGVRLNLLVEQCHIIDWAKRVIGPLDHGD